VAWWRTRTARLLDAVRTGGELPPGVEEETQNAETYAANKDRQAGDIKKDARDSWDRFIAAVEAMTDEDLYRAHPYAAGARLWQTVPGNGHAHLGQHLMFWYLDSVHDEKAAEAAQIWVRDLDRSALSGHKHGLYADYNLACFYGRVGDADKALPLLRTSFKAAPELLEIARKDSDLDRIRNEPRVKELLAT
jgi:hypothetical protein